MSAGNTLKCFIGDITSTFAVYTQPAFTCSKSTMETPELFVFKVKNKDTRTKSMMPYWCFYFKPWTDFTHYTGVSSVDFEQVNADLLAGNGDSKDISWY